MPSKMLARLPPCDELDLLGDLNVDRVLKRWLALVGAVLVEADLTEMGAKARCPGLGRREIASAFQPARLLPVHVLQQQPELPAGYETQFIGWPDGLGIFAITAECA